MSDDPFFLHGPANFSLSGGRTSAYMLWRTIQAHGGELPDYVEVLFCNTGKEREVTLRFVHECGSRWGVRVRWLEFLTGRRLVPASERFEEVGFNSASRNGEPFDRLIAQKKMLPQGRRRFCTEYLKVRTMFDYMEATGHGLPGQFIEVIGLRADEKPRIDKMRNDARNKARHLSFPLSMAGVRKSDVFAFWDAQDFDLELPRGLGNCDHCPFIWRKDRIARAKLDPAGTEWWARHEIRSGRTFGKEESVAQILGYAASSPLLDLDDSYESECGAWCPSESDG